MSTSAATPTGFASVRALRRQRQRNRLGDIEWFDAAYRVYLVALLGGGGVLWLSSWIGEKAVTTATADTVADRGPAAVGVFVALAVLVGLRNGAQGGPLALEAADVAYVMMAPVDRKRALLRPAWQRVRSAVALAAAGGAIAGYLAGARLPGSPTAWALGGALFGTTVAGLWAAAALIAHGLNLRRPLATSIGAAMVVWQTIAACGVIAETAGPTTPGGGLALWGWRQRAVELSVVAVAALGIAIGFALLRRTSLEALAQRSSLVAQLRFAVTMQDLRTVVLLRRQLNNEHVRQQPWRRAPRALASRPVWRRSWHGMSRFPITRVARIVALSAASGVAAAITAMGTTAMVVTTGIALFLVGLEISEPLAQEIDHPDRTDALSVERGNLLAQHLVMPALALVPCAVLAALAAAGTLAWGGAGTAANFGAIAILALPVTMAGASGAVVSVVRDSTELMAVQALKSAKSTNQPYVPPEMAGIGTAVRVLLPVVVSTAGAATLLFARATATGTAGGGMSGGALRGAVAATLVTAAVAAWVRHRDRISVAFNRFLVEGRNYARVPR